MNDASDMNNIGSQGITGIFVIDSQVIMNEYTDFDIQAVYHIYTYFVLSTITYYKNISSEYQTAYELY